MTDILTDEYFMRLAIREAEKAAEEGEIPVGAVIVSGGLILARGRNQTERLQDVTAHAEIIALTAAEDYLGSKYLNDCTLYVTLEPCVMCAGALKWAQIGKLIYGAEDEKNGFSIYSREVLHPKTKVLYGLLESECSAVLKRFFAERR